MGHVFSTIPYCAQRPLSLSSPSSVPLFIVQAMSKATETRPLPPPGENQAYWNISALEAGHLVIYLPFFLDPPPPPSDADLEVPSLSFFLQHSSTETKFVFDLGIRKDRENYPPTLEPVFKLLGRTRIPMDVVDSLRKGGVEPEQVDYVAISHAHWDHIGDPSRFPKSRFILGGGAKELYEPGYPADPTSFYMTDLFAPDRVEFLDADDERWVEGGIGPFPRALDFFRDGSLYIIDAPGHLPGHINMLVRTSPSGGWVYLAGDAAHHWSLITGKCQIAGAPDGKKRFGGCAHEDKAAASETQRRIREAMSGPDKDKLRVLLAHDEPWYKSHGGGNAFWPGKIESL